MAYSSHWRSPSNIALIKYWGKHGLQLPQNPSLSFTLSACHTNMRLSVTPEAGSPGLTVLFNGREQPSFEPKIKSFLALIDAPFPWLKNAALEIDSSNTFPHSAGIASSASAMSALALCIMDINDQINDLTPDNSWWQKASTIARIGSGSASRSVYPYASIWGQTKVSGDSSDLYAIPWGHQMAEVFRDFQDTILIISQKEKAVSSTAGHQLMDSLPFAQTRYEEARKHLSLLSAAMNEKPDIHTFISIVETEALQLHALMMSGEKPFILMEPGTIAVIKEVWQFRKETDIPVCFTLDAGPNVHLLYPNSQTPKVLDWVKNHLAGFCSEGRYILDQVGTGPEKIA